ncbi:MAG: hypothetical protein KH230_20140 [Enterocloster asparagiformis]|nr:hypothetical protein [Enterocloster asparagiformis]
MVVIIFFKNTKAFDRMLWIPGNFRLREKQAFTKMSRIGMIEIMVARPYIVESALQTAGRIWKKALQVWNDIVKSSG